MAVQIEENEKLLYDLVAIAADVNAVSFKSPMCFMTVATKNKRKVIHTLLYRTNVGRGNKGISFISTLVMKQKQQHSNNSSYGILVMDSDTWSSAAAGHQIVEQFKYSEGNSFRCAFNIYI